MERETKSERYFNSSCKANSSVSSSDRGSWGASRDPFISCSLESALLRPIHNDQAWIFTGGKKWTCHFQTDFFFFLHLVCENSGRRASHLCMIKRLWFLSLLEWSFLQKSREREDANLQQVRCYFELRNTRFQSSATSRKKKKNVPFFFALWM